MRRFIAAIGLAIFIAKPTLAAERKSIDQLLSNEAVGRTLQLALQKLPEAKCGGTPCSAPTAEEKAKPPLTVAQARLALKAGVLSASAELCGIDWQRRVFLPFMDAHRKKHDLTDRQLALATVLHAIMQSFMKGDMKSRNERCTTGFRSNIEAEIAAASEPRSAAQ
jgi:hypothetical protein